MNNRRKNKAWLFVLIPLVFGAITGVVMLLWNALLPEILGVKAISFWQAMGILVLSKILFGGFRGGGFRKCRDQKMMQNGDNFSTEERERFKEKMRERFGNNPFCK